MNRSCIRCENETSEVQMICNDCATKHFSENIFWIAASPVVGEPVINRLRKNSKTVLTIGENPEGEVIYKDGKMVMDQIIDFYEEIEDDVEDHHDILELLDNMMAEMGISEDRDKIMEIYFSPTDLKVLSEIFYLVEEIHHKQGKMPQLPGLYMKVGNLLSYVSDRANSPVFSPRFREKVCQDMLSEAERYYDLAIEKSDDDLRPYLFKGRLLMELGRHDEAMECLDKALEIEENDDVKIAYVELLLSRERTDEAEKFLNELLDSKPDEALVWFLKAEELRISGRWGGSIQFYDQAVNRDDGFIEPYVMKGRVLLENQMLQEANDILDRALEKDAESIEAWFTKAKVLHEMDRWGGALQCLNEVLSIEPHMEKAWILKGDILTEKELYEEALEAYELSLEIVPDLEKVIEKKKICKEYLC